MCAHGPDVLPKSCHYLLLVMPMPGHPLTHTLQILSAEKKRENGEENMILKGMKQMDIKRKQDLLECNAVPTNLANSQHIYCLHVIQSLNPIGNRRHIHE